MSMFEKATRLKLRFDSPQGALSVEDLWDIPLTSTRANVANLDNIAKALFKQVKEADTTSFVVKAKQADETVQLQFEVVKHIIDVRLAEAEKAEEAKSNKAKKQMIMSIIAQKKNEQLMGAPLEELEKMVAEL